jgi:hypothetical protein
MIGNWLQSVEIMERLHPLAINCNQLQVFIECNPGPLT